MTIFKVFIIKGVEKKLAFCASFQSEFRKNSQKACGRWAGPCFSIFNFVPNLRSQLSKEGAKVVAEAEKRKATRPPLASLENFSNGGRNTTLVRRNLSNEAILNQLNN